MQHYFFPSFFYYFVSMLTLSLSVVIAEDIDELLPDFPSELADEIMQQSFDERTHYPYDQYSSVKRGEVERNALVWRRDNVQSDLQITQVRLGFRTAVESFKKKNFYIDVDYSQGGRVVVKHSDPALSKHRYGVLTRLTHKENASWGGVIYGKESPSVTFIVGPTERFAKQRAPLLICPRIALQRGKSHFILKPLETEFVSFSGTGTGKVKAEFRSGYDEGALRLGFLTAGLPEVSQPPLELQSRNPTLKSSYLPEQKVVPLSVSQGQPIAVSLTAYADMRNSVGYTKREAHSAVIWAKQRPMKSNDWVTLGTEPLRRLQLMKGLCVQLFGGLHTYQKYDLPHNDQALEQSLEEELSERQEGLE